MVSVMPSSLEHTFTSTINDIQKDNYDPQVKRQRLDNDTDAGTNHRIVEPLSESPSYKEDQSPGQHEEDLLDGRSMAISSPSSHSTYTSGTPSASTSDSLVPPNTSLNTWLTNTPAPDSDIVIKGENSSATNDNLLFGDSLPAYSAERSSDIQSSYLQQIHSSMQAYTGQSYMPPNFYNSVQNAQHSYNAEYLIGSSRNQSGKSAAGSSLPTASLGSSCLSAGNLGSASPYLSPYGTFGSAGSQTYQNSYYGSPYNAAAFSNACNSQSYSAQQGLDSSYYPAAAAAAAAYANPAAAAAAAAAGSYYYGQSYAGYGGGATNNNPAHSSLSPTQIANASISTTPSQSATYQLALPPNGSLEDSSGSFQTLDSPSSPLKDSGSRPRAARSRRSNPSPDPEDKVERVYIWDLDETIILFHSIVTENFPKAFGKDPTEACRIFYAMEDMIFNLGDTHFFFNEIESCDQVHIDDVSSDDNGQDLSNYDFSTDGFAARNQNNAGIGLGTGVRGGVDWMRKLAFRYRKIKEVYTTYRHDASPLMTPQVVTRWREARQEMETLTDSWLTESLKCLNLINSRPSCVNILVSTTQLIPSLTKILVNDLGRFFPIENVYSATKVGIENCFDRIATRFGRKPVYVVIGDGNDEANAAKQLDFPFWRIQSHRDFANLYKALSQCGL